MCLCLCLVSILMSVVPNIDMIGKINETHEKRFPSCNNIYQNKANGLEERVYLLISNQRVDERNSECSMNNSPETKKKCYTTLSIYSGIYQVICSLM